MSHQRQDDVSKAMEVEQARKNGIDTRSSIEKRLDALEKRMGEPVINKPSQESGQVADSRLHATGSQPDVDPSKWANWAKAAGCEPIEYDSQHKESGRAGEDGPFLGSDGAKWAEILRLREEVAGLEQSIELHANLNRRAHVALGGTESGEGSSWHDIPERINSLTQQLAEQREISRVALDERDHANATTEHYYDHLRRRTDENIKLTKQLTAANERITKLESFHACFLAGYRNPGGIAQYWSNANIDTITNAWLAARGGK